MQEFHLVLVCHTEMDFNGSWSLYESVQPRIEEMIARVADAVGKKPKITYCATGEFLGDPCRLDDAFRFIQQGHEIGIHSHLLGSHRVPWHSGRGRYALHLDQKGVLNQDLMAGALRQIAIALGLPPPASHVSGYFTFQETTISILEKAGFSVDCSLLPGEEKNTFHATDDFILCDTGRRKQPYPYRPASNDPLADGHSSIIELPVSGCLGDGNGKEHCADVRRRMESDREIDVFQMFWHHFEFADREWSQGSVADAEEFLVECARMKQVIFSTASEAANALNRSGL